MSSTTGPDNPGTPKPQRRWQAPCPGCGAPVEFQSAASPAAVCSYCRSTVVRDGSTLRRIGKSADLFDDHSPLQLGVAGRLRDRGFTLVGRLQLGYGARIDASKSPPPIEGSWNEWYALFSDGRGGWLSEDNGQYVFVFDLDTPPRLPNEGRLSLQQRLELAGTQWEVSSLVKARLLAAEGELPSPPVLDRSFTVADLRSATDHVATIDYSDAGQPAFSVGQSVRLDELHLSGLREAPDADTRKIVGRGFACPSCGAPVSARMGETLSLTCPSCKSVIDLSQGIGADLSAYRQQAQVKPAIPMGRSGQLAIAGSPVTDWQVVGFSRKKANVGHPDPEERFNWDEYLLYNRREGFAFLLDTDEGWVGYRAMTGIPEDPAHTSNVEWRGSNYRRTGNYPAHTAYVEGEFYWVVEQGQKVRVSDYQGRGSRSRQRLSVETSRGENIWSQGGILSAAQVGAAFGLSLSERMALRPDIAPSSGSESPTWLTVIVVVFFLFIVALDSCTEDDDNGSAGGSYGGYNSGGGHK